MADETITTQADQQPAATPATVTTPPAGALNPEPSQEAHMIPKARFDEVNKKLKEMERAAAESDKARVLAEQTALAEQGKFKELYEAEKAEREKATTEMKKLHQANLRREVAQTVGLPPALASRLVGETEEELTADAKTLLATLPTPQAPNLNGGAGGGDRRPAGAAMRSEAERVEFAARYNLDPRFVN
jgi:hypothetical protein